TNTYSNLNLASTGAFVTEPNTALDISSATYLGAVEGSGNLNGAPLFQIYFSAPLTDLGGLVPLMLGRSTSYGHCGGATCVSAYPIVFGTSGQVSTVPLPGAVWSLLGGLALLFTARRRNAAT
ncbi:MAG: hypothetical protein GY727_12365, partial [Gammaproteobacteria bacterium]|nr:hypothetical protein [Gammaproteobacteria bacterium]